MDRVEHTKFLRVIIDEKLTWANHIKYVSAKISRSNGVLTRAKHLLGIDTLKQLYNTLVLPYLSYCCTIWGGAAKCHINILNVAQKRVIRNITNSHYLDHTEPLYKKLNIMNVSQLYVYQVAIFMYKHHSHMLPVVFINWFKANVPTHNYSTRNATKLYPTLTRTTRVKSHILSQGPIIWNSIPKEIQSVLSIYRFKQLTKTHIMNN